MNQSESLSALSVAPAKARDAVGNVRDLLLIVGLVAIGCLKLHAAVSDPMIDLRTGWSHAAIWIVGCLEIFAALFLAYLWRAKLHRMTRMIQVAILGTFLVATLWRSVDSSGSPCACFGSFEIPSSYVIPPLVILLIGSLSIRRSAVDRPWGTEWNQIRDAFPGTRIGLIVPMLLGLVSIGAMLSPTVRGYCLRAVGFQDIYSDGVDVSGLEAGKQQQVVATLHNDSKEEVEIVGSHNSCKCFSIEKTRFTVGAESSEPVVIQFVAPDKGSFRQRLTLFLSGARQRNVDVEIFGMLLAKGEEL